MHSLQVSRLFPAILVLGAGVLTGCVSSKYQFHPQPRQADALLLRAQADGAAADATRPAIEAVLRSVIVLQGPGSWKKHAYWDEYVVSLANRSDAAVVIESVALTDFQNQALSPGRDPWALEKESRDFESRFASTAGDVLRIGSGVFVASGTGLAAGTAAALAVNAGAWSGMAIAGTAMLAAVPVYAVGTVYRNVSSKQKIAEEFHRRACTLPLTVAPQQLTEGSLFFRVAPGPRQLVLACRLTDGTTRNVIFDLAPLAGLHFKSVTPTSVASR